MEGSVLDDGVGITTALARVWIDNGILHVTYNEGAEVDLEQAKAILEAEATLLAGRKLPALVGLSTARSVTREARALFAGPTAAALQTATALVVRSPLSRMVGNMFLGLNKTLSPSKLFDSEIKANEWLEQFK